MEPKDYVTVAAALVFSIVSFGISRWLQQRTKNTDLVIDENRRKAEQRSREESLKREELTNVGTGSPYRPSPQTRPEPH